MAMEFRLRASSPHMLSTRFAFAALLLLSFFGCQRRDSDTPIVVPTLHSIKVEHSEGDPSVSSEDGGPGFVPSPEDGWVTSEDFTPEGDPRATAGGAIRYWMRFPPTLRILGKDSSTAASGILRDLCYETLLTRHSDTLEMVPRLATHWRVSEDGRTLRFRINPRAHWSDGRPVVADDVVATWDLLMDIGILQPAQQVVYGQFDRPRALSKYIVEVRCGRDSWRNLLTFSGMSILPAHVIGELDGAEFIEKFQFRAVPGSGPYSLREADVRRGRSMTFRRREDYWGRGERFATGLYNFDLIRLVSTEDSVLGLEKMKKGEIDIFRIGKAKDWSVDLPRLDQVRRGLLLLEQVENDEPVGPSGIVINMRSPPLDDVRVRKALCHLYNREKLIAKLFYDAYTPVDSYFPDTEYANDDNDIVRYDPQSAADLLEAAGWRERDSQGYLVQEGQRLRLELMYSSKSVERYLSVFQEDCRKAGVHIHLQQLTRASRYQLTYGTRQFQLATQGWTGERDPNPLGVWHSDLAEANNNANLAGFKNPRVDEWSLQLDTMDDPAERLAALREIDSLIFAEHPCVLGWYTGYVRLAYWNKFGHPSNYLGRTDSAEAVLRKWWIDEERLAALKEAKRDPTMKLSTGDRDQATGDRSLLSPTSDF